MRFRYSCVSPRSLRELDFIIDNSREVTYQTVRKHIGSENMKELSSSLGYDDCDLTLEDDYAVSFHKSKLPDGSSVYYVRHSAIEYIYY